MSFFRINARKYVPSDQSHWKTSSLTSYSVRVKCFLCVCLCLWSEERGWNTQLESWAELQPRMVMVWLALRNGSACPHQTWFRVSKLSFEINTLNFIILFPAELVVNLSQCPKKEIRCEMNQIIREFIAHVALIKGHPPIPKRSHIRTAWEWKAHKCDNSKCLLSNSLCSYR